MTKVKCKKVRAVKFDKKTAKKLWFFMYLALALSLLAQYFVDVEKKHFEIEGVPFFYAAFGLFACVMIIVVSKLLGIFLKRSEDYYDN